MNDDLMVNDPHMRKSFHTVFCFLFFLPLWLAGQIEPVDLEMTDRIKQEGLKNSNIEDLAFCFTDFAGPRLSASKGGERAFEMARGKMEEIGLKHVRMGRARYFWNTDHISFDEVNLPAFTFIQDQGEFGRGFSTTMDTYERLLLPALKQNAAIMASMAYHAAMRDQKIPGKPLK